MWTALSPLDGTTILQAVTCFEAWTDSMIKFTAVYRGTVSMNITSVGYDGVVRNQASNVVTFDDESPTVSSLLQSGTNHLN